MTGGCAGRRAVTERATSTRRHRHKAASGTLPTISNAPRISVVPGGPANSPLDNLPSCSIFVLKDLDNTLGCPRPDPPACRQNPGTHPLETAGTSLGVSRPPPHWRAGRSVSVGGPTRDPALGILLVANLPAHHRCCFREKIEIDIGDQHAPFYLQHAHMHRDSTPQTPDFRPLRPTQRPLPSKASPIIAPEPPPNVLPQQPKPV